MGAHIIIGSVFGGSGGSKQPPEMDHIEQEGLLIEISFSIQVQAPKLISPPVPHWQSYKHDSVPCFSLLGKWDSVDQNARGGRK